MVVEALLKVCSFVAINQGLASMVVTAVFVLRDLTSFSWELCLNVAPPGGISPAWEVCANKADDLVACLFRWAIVKWMAGILDEDCRRSVGEEEGGSESFHVFNNFNK